MIHERIATHLQARLTDRATGRSESLIVDNRPRDVLFAGCLLPRPDAAEDNLESAEDFYARLAPSAIQLRFLVRGAAEARIEIRPSFHIYYRVMPPFEAQARRTRSSPDGTPLDEQLVKSYRQLVPELAVAVEDLRFGSHPVVSLANSANRSVAATVSADPESLGPMDSWRVPSASLLNADALKAWCFASERPAQPPEFQVDLHTEVSAWGDLPVRQVTVSLVNRSHPNEVFEKSDYWEQAIFNAEISVKVVEGDAALVPYVFTALPNSYRFNRDQWGIGVNCVAEVSQDRMSVRSSTVPSYRQKVLEHRHLRSSDLGFADLRRDPIPVLEAVLREMLEYKAVAWERTRSELKSRTDFELLREEFERDAGDFEREISEFRDGIRLLAEPRHGTLLRAFQLMNESFRRWDRSPGWRLFQLVFVVRNLTSLAARQWDDISGSDDVEVLWFPTGGGKTEAFLGLLVVALFFDRLRGRQEGVTGVIRLPLRLLSLQQFQRVVRIIAVADQVRSATVGGEPFSVGYWIGQGGSPNKVEPSDARAWEADPTLCQQYRKIRRCPYCRKEVVLRFDRARWSLIHHCTGNVCGHGGDLPIYIVDDEIYRFLPSVVVGTVDKLAALGFQQRFSNLLGWPGTRCPTHGFSPRGECLVPGCRQATVPASLRDPVPSLHIQDELHLLKEDLGAFDGHYETAVMGIQEMIPGGRPWKTVAATATIEQYDWHVWNLYCKRARRFPCPGPSWTETFYAVTEERPNRIFIGFLPFNRSHINSMISVLWGYHSELIRLRQRLPSAPREVFDALDLPADTSADEVELALRDYEVSLTYVLTRKAGDQMAESLATQVASYLRDEGHEPLETRSLTGQSTGQEIEAILAEIDQSARRPAGAPALVDAVIATSMISHGVDIDRFNLISFFGMPRMTAEYIQASSRVGRKFPGIVVTVFSPARERDRSHFHQFLKYHEYLERLVEPAAINRWARFAVKHTLPGLVIGYLLNILGRQTSRKLYMEDQLYAALHVDRTFTESDIIEAVQKLYRADLQESGVLAKDAERGIVRFLNGLRRKARRTLWQQPDFRPMRSLRDVEEPVFFTPSNYSKEAFRVWAAGRNIARGEIGSERD